ncbi:MAG: malate synthase A, partial [Chthoniobacterales bacterium]|nr:malate synthase A [Chthoniobacterales bacterium]
MTKADQARIPDGVRVVGQITPAFAEILTPDALEFVAKLQRRLGGRRRDCLERRMERQTALDAGGTLDFLPETKKVRESDWTCAAIPPDLRDRRVEITGPTDRKMVINALNCGAKMFMADFEDANSPTWENMVDGQINLRDAIRRTITFTNPNGKEYQLNEKTATLLVRPRGWHLAEKHVLVDGEPVAGGLFDFGLYFFHNAKELIKRGSGPYFYLPKMESHLEARIWNDAFK